MLRTCLSSWRVARNRSAHYLHKRYDNFDVIVCSFCFWCFELLEAQNTIIFEPFIQWKKRSKRVQAFATDSEPLKGLSGWYTMQKTVWNTFCCRSSKISEKVFAEVFATFYTRGEGFASSCTFLNASFSVLHATFYLQCILYTHWGRECQSERAPASRGNAFWNRVLDSSSERYSRDSEAEYENTGERVRHKVGEFRNLEGRPKADQRAQCNFWRERAMHKWSNIISKVRCKWSPLRGKLCHLARKERFFCPTRQFFKGIAILWRNS